MSAPISSKRKRLNIPGTYDLRHYIFLLSCCIFSIELLFLISWILCFIIAILIFFFLFFQKYPILWGWLSNRTGVLFVGARDLQWRLDLLVRGRVLPVLINHEQRSLQIDYENGPLKTSRRNQRNYTAHSTTYCVNSYSILFIILAFVQQVCQRNETSRFNNYISRRIYYHYWSMA